MRKSVDVYDHKLTDFVTSAGSPVHVQFVARLRDDGSVVLVESGTEDIQSKIDSFASDCELSNIISRFTAGDSSALNAYPVNYGDFTRYPKSLVEAYNLIEDGKKSFSSLPEDVRYSYDNDYMKWLADAGSSKWINVMSQHVDLENVSIVDKPVIDKPVKEVITDA